MIAVATFEYLHTWIPYYDDEDEDEEDVEFLQSELSRLGLQGWELVNMTPHWEWTYNTTAEAASYSVPDYISRWYCTFKRSSG